MKTPVIRTTVDAITEDAVRNSAAKRVPAGSVLCVMRSGILAHTFPVAVNEVEVTINQDLRALIVRDGVSAKYVAHFLRFSGSDILQSCSKHGTTVASVEAPRLNRVLVPLPDIDTQRRITARIDELFAEIEDGEEELRRARQDLAIYRKSLLKAAVTGELTKAWRVGKEPNETGEQLLRRILTERRVRWQADSQNKGKRYTEPSGPLHTDNIQLPSGWTAASMPQLGDFGRGKSKHRPRNDPRLYGGPYPFVQTGIVTSSRGRICSYDQSYSEMGLAQSKLWPAETLCITIAANIAKTGVLAFEACFPDSVVGLTCDAGVDPHFVELVMRNLQAQLEAGAPATAQKNINLDTLKFLAVPLPPSDEQHAIIECYRDAEAACDLVARREIDADVATLRQSILRAAFNGELAQ